jgi:DNA-binding MarR family transcriptional regulator
MLSLRELPRIEVLQEDARHIPTLDPQTVLAFLSVLVVAADVERRLDSHFARYGLSHGRFVILMLLRRAPRGGPLTPAQLADAAEVTRATVTGLLDSLEADGYVARSARKGDGRMIDVRLTKNGKALLERTLPDHYARIASFMVDLTRAERMTLIELMGKVRERIARESNVR